MTPEGPPAVMTDLPASLPSLPRYGESTLADLACSVLASLGAGAEPNPLQLPPADRACLLVVDGLGWELLREHPAAAPFLSELAVTGHVSGRGSDAWRYPLGPVDKLAEQLSAALPRGTALHVTADHGMVDVPPQDRVDADAVPGLRAGVALLGGEPRARHVYARPGAAADVLAAWRENLGHRGWAPSPGPATPHRRVRPGGPALAPPLGVGVS